MLFEICGRTSSSNSPCAKKTKPTRQNLGEPGEYVNKIAAEFDSDSESSSYSSSSNSDDIFN